MFVWFHNSHHSLIPQGVREERLFDEPISKVLKTSVMNLSGAWYPTPDIAPGSTYVAIWYIGLFPWRMLPKMIISTHRIGRLYYLDYAPSRYAW